MRGSGEALYFSADPMTKTRLRFCQRTLLEVLGVDATNTVLIRRAIEVYAETLTDVINAQELAATVPDHKLPDEKTDRKALKAKLIHLRERKALKKATAGDTRALSKEQLDAAPIKPLNQLVEDHRVKQPSPIEMIRADLARWASQTTTAEKAPDDYF
jgi:hypothetical protein